MIDHNGASPWTLFGDWPLGELGEEHITWYMCRSGVAHLTPGCAAGAHSGTARTDRVADMPELVCRLCVGSRPTGGVAERLARFSRIARDLRMFDYLRTRGKQPWVNIWDASDMLRSARQDRDALGGRYPAFDEVFATFDELLDVDRAAAASDPELTAAADRRLDVVGYRPGGEESVAVFPLATDTVCGRRRTYNASAPGRLWRRELFARYGAVRDDAAIVVVSPYRLDPHHTGAVVSTDSAATYEVLLELRAATPDLAVADLLTAVRRLT